MDREIFKAYTVYFDFDSSSVRPADAANVQHVAEYLSSHGDCALLIEGHCDERGTDEYNQALGERRAQSVKETIANAGIASHRVRTLSYGESKPAEDGTTAEAYAKNRRGEFVLLLPKTEGGSTEAINTPVDVVE
ncbi:MAG: OmpA family protein [Verrucomicrobia bacterium]|nr:OmpA family protein [Verrucomicrobiota bacterium]